VNQDKFAMEVLKKFEMKNCVKVNTLIECGVKMSKNDEGGDKLYNIQELR